MSKGIRAGAVLLATVFVLAALFGWRLHQLRLQEERMSQMPPPAVVTVTEVQVGEWTQAVHAIGGLRATNGVRVANEVAGVVEEIAFESGQIVEAGDVLIRLDGETDVAALETREAEVRLAEQQFERFRNLLGQNAVSRAEFDEARANFDAAKARVHEQRALLDKKTIRAPFSGVLGLREVDLGEFLAVGTPIVGINMLDPIQVDYAVPERELPNLSVGDRVEVSVAAFQDEVFVGEVLALDSSVLPSTRTLRIRARLDNQDFRLRPGMFANVRTVRPTTRTVLTVPRTAVSYNTFGDFVFRVVDGESGRQAERVSVTTGEARDGRVELVDGIEAGATVVATGLLRLRNGQPVTIEGQDAEDA